jgi:two-component system phosphate regulon response regulator PhoB
MVTHILLTEDDSAVGEGLKYHLAHAGFKVTWCLNGDAALAALRTNALDIAILDWMLPTISGLDMCRMIRKSATLSALPVILLTARAQDDDRVYGLDMGADDYITKPFVVAEVIARVNAVLRRAAPGGGQALISFGDVVMDQSKRRVKRDSQDIHLGPTEFKLLAHLMENPGEVFSREQLLAAVWGESIHVELRTVDVHVRRLRKALNKNHERDPIRTVRSAGYALDETYSTS